MSDAAWDRMVDEIGAGFYEEHFIQAIDQFTTERLQSYYLKHPGLLRPAHQALADARSERVPPSIWEM